MTSASSSRPGPAPGPGSIRPSHFLADLWQHRDLLRQFTLRSVQIRHKGTHLGLLWSFLTPLLMLGLYVLVFGYIFEGKLNTSRPETKIDYALAIFLGLIVFQLFAEVLTTAPQAIVSNPNLVKKVVFPLSVLPASVVGAALFHMLVSLGMLALGMAIHGTSFTLNALWLPVIFVALLLFVLGVSWFVAALGVFYRDMQQITAFLSMVFMYASAIFYPVQALTGTAWMILRLNPLLLLVELARRALLWNQPVNPVWIIYLFTVGLVVCYAGHWFFRKTAHHFADTL